MHPRDRFLPHGIEPDIVAAVARSFEQVSEIQRVWLVRKALRIQPERPLYVLGVLSQAPWWRPVSRVSEKELMARISRECRAPGDTLIVSLRLNSSFRAPLRQIRGGEIYRRG